MFDVWDVTLRELGTHRARLREEVVDARDAPHALQVLLGLNGDRAHGAGQLPSSHGHLDAGLWPRRRRRDGGRGLRPGQTPLPLSDGQGGAGVGLGLGLRLGFSGRLSIAARRRDGESGRLS